MMKGLLAWIIFGLSAVACLLWIGFGVQDDLREDGVFHDIISERLDIAESAKGDIHIGVSGDWKNHKPILQGVELAAEIINDQGGLLGRQIVLDARDDQGTVAGALGVAQAFATKPEIGFVIGHTSLNLNNSVAQNYEFYGLMRLSPNTAGSNTADFSLLFENGMPPEQTSGAILTIAKEKGWNRIGLIYAKSDHALRHARRFESMANKHDIKVPLSFGYEGRGSGISKHMEHWKRELDLDAMVLAVHPSDIASLIGASRALGINCPFIVLDEQPAMSAQMAATLGTVYWIASPKRNPAHNNLDRKFEARFKTPMTAEGMLGYDAMNILAGAIKKANSFVPANVAQILTDAQVDDSLSGTLRFDQKGSAIKRPPIFVTD